MINVFTSVESYAHIPFVESAITYTQVGTPLSIVQGQREEEMSCTPRTLHRTKSLKRGLIHIGR